MFCSIMKWNKRNKWNILIISLLILTKCCQYLNNNFIIMSYYTHIQ